MRLVTFFFFKEKNPDLKPTHIARYWLGKRFKKWLHCWLKPLSYEVSGRFETMIRKMYIRLYIKAHSVWNTQTYNTDSQIYSPLELTLGCIQSTCVCPSFCEINKINWLCPNSQECIIDKLRYFPAFWTEHSKWWRNQLHLRRLICLQD